MRYIQVESESLTTLILRHWSAILLSPPLYPGLPVFFNVVSKIINIPESSNFNVSSSYDIV